MKKITGIILFLFYVSVANAEFELVLIHTEAANQPDFSTGQSIVEIKAYRDSIYLGYGDFGFNTGPIEICKFTPPNSDLICEFTFSTEQINRYRELNG